MGSHFTFCFYHDIVYDVLQNDNEEKSALLAEKRLNSIRVHVDKLISVKNKLTKTHVDTNDYDTNLFSDANLSILEQDWQAYENYTQ